MNPKPYSIYSRGTIAISPTSSDTSMCLHMLTGHGVAVRQITSLALDNMTHIRATRKRDPEIVEPLQTCDGHAGNVPFGN